MISAQSANKLTANARAIAHGTKNILLENFEREVLKLSAQGRNQLTMDLKGDMVVNTQELDTLSALQQKIFSIEIEAACTEPIQIAIREMRQAGYDIVLTLDTAEPNKFGCWAILTATW